MTKLTCPYQDCEHKHGYYTDDEIFDMQTNRGKDCDGCGRKIRVNSYCEEEDCISCGRPMEDEEGSIERIELRPWCKNWNGKTIHDWQTTLSPDMNKCSSCNSVQKVEVPSLVAA